MKIILLPFLLTFIIAGELEVDGNLKVSGNIDAQNQAIKNVGIPQELTDAINGNVLQDALRDDGIYEIKYYGVMFNNAFNGGNYTFHANYKEIGEGNYSTEWESFLNGLLQQGWIISRAFSIPPLSGSNNTSLTSIHVLYELKKLTSE